MARSASSTVTTHLTAGADSARSSQLIGVYFDPMAKYTFAKRSPTASHYG
jgi:hypothetical protein